MSDEFTEVTSESWFSRIMDSIKGILVGIILIPVAIFLLFWNENRAVDTAKGLKEGAAAVVSADPAKVESAHEQKLVHLTGEATCKDVLRDPLFAAGATAIRLTRVVEMYQWKEEKSSETRKKLGGGTETATSYKYQPNWSDTLINSGEFKQPDGHQNPTSMIAEKSVLVSPDVKMGAYKLPDSVLGKMQGDVPLPATQEDLAKVAPDLQSKLHLSAGMFYVGKEPNTPAVGDQRVSFKILKPATWSVIARQTGTTLEPYPTRVGSPIERVESGTVSADAMFKHAESENTTLTWLLRLAGFVLMAIGFGLILKPFSVLGDVIPLIGNIIGTGGALISMLLSFVISIIVIAVAWFVVRPLLSIALLVVAVAGIVMAWRRGSARKAARA